MTPRIPVLLAILVLVVLGSTYYLWEQRPQASTATSATYYCLGGEYQTKPSAAAGTFAQEKTKPLEWTWQAWPGWTTAAQTNSDGSTYQETLIGYDVQVWQYRAGPYEDHAIETTRTTNTVFSSAGLGNRTAAGGTAWDVYKLKYRPVCSTNDPARSEVTGSYSAFSNEVKAVYSSSSTSSTQESSSTATAGGTSTSANSEASSSETSASSSSSESEATASDTSENAAPSSTTSSSSSSTKAKTTQSAKPAASAESEAATKSTELFSTAAQGLPADTITESKSFATLPGSTVTIGIVPGKSAKSVKLTLGSETKDAVKDDATGRYVATFSAPATVADHSATAAVTYSDGTSEDVALTLKVVAKGIVRDASGAPVAGATVTLRQQASSGAFADWDPTGTDQQNPVTTDASGSYGFVVPAGAYQAVAATNDGRTVASDTVTVSPMNGPVAPDLTLVASATQTTTSNSGIPAWAWVAGVVLLLLVGGYAFMKSRTAGDTTSSL